MKQIAFHKVYRPSGSFAVMPVITVDEEGFCQSCRALTGEMPGVIWSGGVGMLLPPDVVPHPGDSIAALLREVASKRAQTGLARSLPSMSDLSKTNPYTGSDALRLWKADGLSADADILTPAVRWCPVF